MASFFKTKLDILKIDSAIEQRVHRGADKACEIINGFKKPNTSPTTPEDICNALNKQIITMSPGLTGLGFSVYFLERGNIVSALATLTAFSAIGLGMHISRLESVKNASDRIHRIVKSAYLSTLCITYLPTNISDILTSEDMLSRETLASSLIAAGSITCIIEIIRIYLLDHPGLKDHQKETGTYRKKLTDSLQGILGLPQPS